MSHNCENAHHSFPEVKIHIFNVQVCPLKHKDTFFADK